MKPSTTDRRRAALALLAGGLGVSSWAQPRAESVRLLCGYPPGGAADILCRKLAEKLSGRLAPTLVVDNKPGAAGRLAAEELKRAPRDGSTMLLTPASVVTMYPHVYRQLAYDPFADFVPVGAVASTGFALAVGSRVPPGVRSVQEFARWCRDEPAAATCGNAGAGSMPHFLATLMARELRIELTHVPYRNGPLAMQAAAAGEIAAALATEGAARALSAGGRVRVLATTWAERSVQFAQVPTFNELGWPALTRHEWFGMFMPARTPAEIVDHAGSLIRTTLDSADIRETWDKASLVIDTSSAAQLRAAMRQEHDFWGHVVKASGFTPEA